MLAGFKTRLYHYLQLVYALSSLISQESAESYGDFYMGLKGDYKVASYNIKGKRMDTIVTVQPVKGHVCAPIGELSTGRVGHCK